LRVIQSWAIGVETGASQSTAMNAMTTQGSTYQHYEGIWDTTSLAANIGNKGQIMCPQANMCGLNCNGFCSCTAPNVNTCSCPTCASANCQVSTCSNVAVGCVSQPKICNDQNGVFAF